MTAEELYKLVEAAYTAIRAMRHEADKRSLLTIDIDASVACRSATEALHCQMGGEYQLARLARAYARSCEVRDHARDDYERTFAERAVEAAAAALRAAAWVNERMDERPDQRAMAYHPLRR